MVAQGLSQLEEQSEATEQNEDLVCEPGTRDTTTAGADMGE